MSSPRLDPEQRREFVRDVCLAMAGVRSVCEYDQIHAGPIVEQIWQAGYAKGFVERDSKFTTLDQLKEEASHE